MASVDAWEASLARLADDAALHRSLALSMITSHVYAVAELVRARVDERGGNGAERDAAVAGMVEALRVEINAHLDRLVASRPGS